MDTFSGLWFVLDIFCFPCNYMNYRSIFFRVAYLVLGQSCDCPSASEYTLKYMSMAECNRDVTPLLPHWSYVSFALSHRCVKSTDTTKQQQYLEVMYVAMALLIPRHLLTHTPSWRCQMFWFRIRFKYYNKEKGSSVSKFQLFSKQKLWW